MKRQVNDRISGLKLPALDGKEFDTGDLKGKRFLLAFFRFASCPFCNLRVHDLVSRFDEFGDDFTVVAIFDSSLENLQRHAGKHQAPFQILADEQNVYYREYGIEHSVLGVLKGMLLRMPTLLTAMFRGYLPLIIKGSMTTMPADLLVDENGIIQLVHYGKDEGDHLPFEVIKQFSLDSEIKTSNHGESSCLI